MSTLEENARKVAERTRREQGLPPKIEDPVTIARIADIISAGEEA